MKQLIHKWEALEKPYQIYFFGLVTFCLSFLSLRFYPHEKWLYDGLSYSSLLAFSVGFAFWVWPKLKSLWSTFVGKTILSIGHIFVLLCTTALSHDFVAYALGLPPHDFNVTLGFLVFFLYIPMWALISSIILAIAAIIFQISAFISKGWSAWKLFGHMAGAITIAFIMSSSFDQVILNKERISPSIRWIALFSDYHYLSNHPSTIDKERIFIHENGVISVAHIKNNNVVIEIRDSE